MHIIFFQLSWTIVSKQFLFLQQQTRKIKIMKDYSHIKGWGVDADPENEPTYPMKKYTGDDHKRLNYQRPVQQSLVGIKEFHSNERPNFTAVFGTSTPPSGLSGLMRKKAFTYSED